MSDPAVAPASIASVRHERLTRLLAHAGALALGLTVLLPRLWYDARGDLHLIWPWDSRPEGASASEWLWVGDGFSPALALLLVVSLVAWVSAGRLPLARRGRWLVVPTLLCLSLLGNRADGTPRVLTSQLAWLVLPGLGLVLSGTADYQRLGRAICTVAGLLMLGIVLWPSEDWDWPLLTAVFGAEQRLLVDQVYKALIAVALATGLVLVWMGLAGENLRISRRAAIVGFALTIVLAFASALLGPFERPEPTDNATALVRVWNQFRWFVRVYVEGLLVTVGLFAWIVGAREEQPPEAVFD